MAITENSCINNGAWYKESNTKKTGLILLVLGTFDGKKY